MSHMVIYRGADGKPGFQQIDDLAAAVAFVERLRNEQSVENSRIYRLEQVQYRFETYFQVRLDDGSVVPAAPLSTPARILTDAPAVKEPVVEAVRAAAPNPPPPSPPSPPAPPAAVRTPVPASVAAVAVNAADDAPETAASEVADAANGIRRGLFGR